MSDYRDDGAAARLRARALEEELEAQKLEMERQRADLEQERARLAAAERELVELRGARPAPPAPVNASRERACSSCGKQNAPHYKFCLGCGADLASAPAPPPTFTPEPTDPPPPPKWTGTAWVVFAVATLLIVVGLTVMALR